MMYFYILKKDSFKLYQAGLIASVFQLRLWKRQQIYCKSLLINHQILQATKKTIIQIKNPDALNKIVIDIMKHFEQVLYMNIGEQDIKDKKISECLILNKSLKVTYNPTLEPFQNMKHFSIEMDQYYTPNFKNNLSQSEIKSGHYEIQNFSKDKVN